MQDVWKWVFFSSALLGYGQLWAIKEFAAEDLVNVFNETKELEPTVVEAFTEVVPERIEVAPLTLQGIEDEIQSVPMTLPEAVLPEQVDVPSLSFEEGRQEEAALSFAPFYLPHSDEGSMKNGHLSDSHFSEGVSRRQLKRTPMQAVSYPFLFYASDKIRIENTSHTVLISDVPSYFAAVQPQLLVKNEPVQEALPSPSPISPPSKTVFDPHSLKKDWGVWLSTEVLFWQSNMDDLDYAVDSKSTTRITHGHSKQPNFAWDLGCRVGLGYKLPHDQWDLLANYTYVHAHAEGSAHKEEGAVFPIWATPLGLQAPFFVSQAHAHWRAQINIADLSLGRTCFASQWLMLRPFLGVRGLFIDQTYQLQYKGGNAFPEDTDKMHLDNDFWGIGARMGLNSLWGLGAGFGIYGDGSLSLLSGHFDVHEHEKLEHTGVQRMNVEKDVDNVVVAADLALGLQWDYLFSKDRYHFGVKLGWEFNIFIDQNQFFNFTSTEHPGAVRFQDGDLAFQGVTLGFRFDF